MSRQKGKRVVIIGGGPAGLSAAWFLAGSDCEVTLLERQDQLGGLCLTTERDEFRFDLGGHRFISNNQELIDRVLDLMGDNMLVRQRKSIILLKGKVFNYPLTASDIIRNMGATQYLHTLLSYIKSQALWRLGRRPDVSFEDWIVNRFGEILYEVFFRPYTEKLWGICPSKISSDWASQRISLLNLWDVVLRLLKFKGGKVRTYARSYYYPKFGIGQLFERIGEEVVARGANVVLNAEATELVAEGDKITAVNVVVNGDERNIPCDYVVSTMPLSALARAISPRVPSEILTDSSHLKFRPMRFLNIMINRPKISDNTWIYVPDKTVNMTRIQEPQRRSPYMAPKGKTSLMLEIPCNEDDSLWSMHDEDLLNICLGNLKTFGIDIEGSVLGYFSTRTSMAYPIYSLDYKERRSRVLEAVWRYSNLIPCGRQGVFRYIFTDTAMEMGMQAAKYILGEGSLRRDEIAKIKNAPELIEVSVTTR